MIRAKGKMKMSKSKKCFAALFILLTAFCFTINSAAHLIDGNIDDTTEWNGRPFLNLADNKDTGCSNELILLRYEFRPDKKILFISFQCVEYNNIVDINNCAFEININYFSPITITLSGAEYDEELFKVSSAWSEQINGESMEAKITFLENVGDKLDFRVSTTDSHGVRSKQYALTIDEYIKDTGTVSTTKSKKSDASKKKTAVTKWTTAVYSTVNVKDYTTSEYSTVSPPDDDIQNGNEATTEPAVSVQSKLQYNGRIILKTVSICIVVVAFAAFVSVLLKRRKQ